MPENDELLYFVTTELHKFLKLDANCRRTTIEIVSLDDILKSYPDGHALFYYLEKITISIDLFYGGNIEIFINHKETPQNYTGTFNLANQECFAQIKEFITKQSSLLLTLNEDQ